MDMGLKDKVVLVSGSSQGIGKAVAEAFLEEGAKVLVTGIMNDAFEATKTDFSRRFRENVAFYSGDLTDKKTIGECLSFLLAKFKGLDTLVANIGSGKTKPVLESGGDDWQKMMNINLFGTIELVNSALPLIKKTGKGSIVFTASIAGLENTGAPAPYAAAKSALIAYSKSLSQALAADGIRVNCVAPGNIVFSGGRWEEILKENPQAIKNIENNVAMKRIGKPEEIAPFVVFLASEKASFATGSCFVIDGGQMKGY